MSYRKTPRKIWAKVFQIVLASPDGNSRRMLRLRKPGSLFAGWRLMEWDKGEKPKLEAWFDRRWVWPEW